MQLSASLEIAETNKVVVYWSFLEILHCMLRNFEYEANIESAFKCC